MASAKSHIEKAELVLSQLADPAFHRTRSAQVEEAQLHATLAQAIALTQLVDKEN